MSWQDTFKRRWKAITSTLSIGALFIYLSGIFSDQPNIVVSSDLTLIPVSAQEYRPAQTYSTEFTVPPDTYRITISSNFVTDGASIPAIMVPELGVSPWSGVIIRAALVHDALYATELLPRSKADKALRSISLQDGLVPKKAEAVHRAVADWGGEVWAKHTPKSIAAARELVELKLLTNAP